MTPPSFPPPNVPPFLKHVWVLFVLSTLVQTLVSWNVVKARFVHDPKLEPTYRKLFLAFAVAANIPWVSMGVLIEGGGVGSLWSFLMPWQKEPPVLGWWAAMAALACLVLGWIFAGGAETLEKYPGLPFVPQNNAGKIKFVALLVVGWNVVFGTAMFFWPAFMNGESFLPEADSVLPFVFPFLFIGMWILVSWVLSQMSGWAVLAEKYPGERDFTGPGLRGRSGRFGMTGYNGVLNLMGNQQGFYLSVLFLFRIGHQPIFVPWGDIKAVEQPGFFTNGVALEFARTPGIVLKLRKSDVLELKKRIGSQAFKDIS